MGISTNPFPTITDALTAANGSFDTASAISIKVMEGTYSESLNIGKKNLEIVGGFMEGDWSTQDVDPSDGFSYPSIINGTTAPTILMDVNTDATTSISGFEIHAVDLDSVAAISIEGAPYIFNNILYGPTLSITSCTVVQSVSTDNPSLQGNVIHAGNALNSVIINFNGTGGNRELLRIPYIIPVY